jgi:hypothetical protein
MTLIIPILFIAKLVCQEKPQLFQMGFQPGDICVFILMTCIFIFFTILFIILVWFFLATVYFLKDPVIFAVEGIKKFLLMKQSGILLLLERGSKISIKNVKTVFFSLKNAIIMAGKYCNTIFLLAIKKFLQLFTDIKSFFSCLIENQKLIEWFTRAKPFFYPPYVVTLAGLTLQKPAMIRDYGLQIIEIYSTFWSGVFGHCFGFVCGVIIVLFYLFLGVLYIQHGVEQVKHGNTWDKLLCLVRRISRVTLGMLALYLICKYGGIVIMWNKDWDILYGMLVCWLTGWVLPMPSICCMTMLPTNFSFDQPVTSQAVVASPRAGVTVLMRIDEQEESVAVSMRVDDSVASQAGVARPRAGVAVSIRVDESLASQAVVASVPLAEQPVASQAGVVSPPAARRPVILIRPPYHDTIYDQMGAAHLPFVQQPVPLTAFPLWNHFNFITDLRSVPHTLFPRQTGIGMPPIWEEEALPHQRDLRGDDRQSFLNPWERIVPVIAGELPILEATRVPYIEWQNRLNNPFRDAIVSARDGLNLEVPLGPCRPNLFNDETLLKMAAVEALNIEWSIMQYHDKLLTQVFPLKERLEMEISGIETQMEHFQQDANPDHLRIVSLNQEYQVNKFRLRTLMHKYQELTHRLSFLGLSQDLNNARGETNVCLFKHNQFLGAILEGKVDFPRLARAEDMRRIEPIYYPALYDRYPALQPDVTRPLMKWEFGVMRQQELNKAIAGGRSPYLITL